jgi:predicted nucleic acid-binding protein
VKAFYDTSVLVPVFYGDHEHHPASLSLFLQFTKDDADDLPRLSWSER